MVTVFSTFIKRWRGTAFSCPRSKLLTIWIGPGSRFLKVPKHFHTRKSLQNLKTCNCRAVLRTVKESFSSYSKFQAYTTLCL